MQAKPEETDSGPYAFCEWHEAKTIATTGKAPERVPTILEWLNDTQETGDNYGKFTD